MEYICKCGRVVKKSINADNTGNRDTAGCEGCPYLLPWGPMVWEEGQKAYVQDVKGQECRMSPTINYATTYRGQADDKCTLHIVSLDLDFLDEVQAWIYDHAADTLTAGFSRGSIRGIEFSDKGRYSLSVSCAQNKKGMAAKAALLAEFFGPDKHRLDMTTEEEKAHILAAIEVGKSQVQKGEEKKVEYIISRNIDNGLLYSYYCGAFWFWDEHVDRWILSDFTRDLYEKNKKTFPNDTPEDFMYGGDFEPVDEWDITTGCINALLEMDPKKEKAKCKSTSTAPEPAAAATMDKSAAEPEPQTPATKADAGDLPAPASPADVGAAEHSLSAAAPASLEVPPSGSAAFDYSGLDDQTVTDLHLAEREYMGGRKLAEMGLRRMADGVAIAHDALCVTIATKCRTGDGAFTASGNTFGRWCESMGLNRKAAERLLRVSKLMDNSSPREQKVLEELSPSLLYAAAKPSAPAELVQAVKDGDITTHKQYQEAMAQLKAEREAREKAEKDAAGYRADSEAARAAADKYHRERDEAYDARNSLLDQQTAYIEKVQQYKEIKDAALKTVKQQREKTAAADARARSAEKELAEARKERDGARDALQAAKLRGDRLKAENDDLKARPIEAAVVDEDEVNRRVDVRVQAELSAQKSVQSDAAVRFAMLFDTLKETINRMAAEVASMEQAGSPDADRYRNALRAALLHMVALTERRTT